MLPLRRRPALLTGVSLAAMVMTGAHAAAPRTFSPAWFAAGSAGRAAAVRNGQASSPSIAALASRRSAANLSLLGDRLRAAATLQASAAALASAQRGTSAIPDGVGAGGLQPAGAPGTAAWLGAAAPVQTSAPGARLDVTIRQTGSLAALTWNSFNVGSRTNLNFVQQNAAGVNQAGWVVLNRLSDATAAPSTILGRINAPGRVYVINRSGIIFGQGSQTNVGSLLATTGLGLQPTASDPTGLAGGIYGNSVSGVVQSSFTGATAPIIVEAGAQIVTAVPTASTAGGGSVLLLGNGVTNAGQISAPQGQVLLASGDSFALQAGAGTQGNALSTTRGTEVGVGKGATVRNTGLLTADLGDVTLAGGQVLQDGVALTTTSVNVRGTVHLLTDRADPTAEVRLGAGSVTAVLPNDSAETVPDSNRSGLITQSASLNATRSADVAGNAAQGTALYPIDTRNYLFDRLDLGRVEISTGGNVDFASGSLALAQGGQIAVGAGRRVLAETGSALDVSGNTSAVLGAQSRILTVSVNSTPLRDAPVNRTTGLLSNLNLYIDLDRTVTVPGTVTGYGGNVYSGGGLVEVSGQIAGLGHTIAEWTAVGGTIQIAAGSVVGQSGSSINLAGGGVTTAAGLRPQSWLISSDGRLYNANAAPADITYTGVYNGQTEDHPRWAITKVFRNPLIAPAYADSPAFVTGRDAGSLLIGAPSVTLASTVESPVFAGSRQSAARPANATDGYALGIAVVPEGGTLSIGTLAAGVGAQPLFGVDQLASDARIGVGDAAQADTLTLTSVLPKGVAGVVRLDSEVLTQAALGGLTVDTLGTVSLDQGVSLAPGGAVALSGRVMLLHGGITARAGQVAIGDAISGSFVVPTTGTTTLAISLDAGVTVDTRGQWTNSAREPGDLSGLGRLSGGSVIFATNGGDLSLGVGSLIDVSGGGAELQGGKTQGGSGGSISLLAGQSLSGNSGTVTLAGTLRGFATFGSSRPAGRLTIQAPHVRLANDIPASPGTLVLTPAFFLAGFATYDIDGTAGLTVAPATTITPEAPTLNFTPASQAFDTGADPEQALSVGLLPLYTADPVQAKLTQRPGASLVLRGQPTLPAFKANPAAVSIGEGSLVAVDPGQSVSVVADGQLTLQGTISAPGGSVSLTDLVRNYDTIIGFDPTLSVWLGSTSRIDVAGQAAIAVDRLGHRYGTVTAGGTVVLGAAPGVADSTTGQLVSTNAYVVVRPGAVIDASGAAGVIDLPTRSSVDQSVLTVQQASQTRPVLVATDGGTISLSSYAGVSIDGALSARQGGAGAVGGVLEVALESPLIAAADNVPLINLPTSALRGRFLTVGQRATTTLAPGLAAGETIDPSLFGTTRIGVDQVAAGGFGSLDLTSRDGILFDGSVSLALGRGVTLVTTRVSDSKAEAVVTVSAPVVSLRNLSVQENGQLDFKTTDAVGLDVELPAAGILPLAASTLDAGQITLAADLINVDGYFAIGAVGDGSGQNSAVLQRFPDVKVPTYNGFGNVVLASAGDIRVGAGTLTTSGNLTAIAAQVFPRSGVQAVLAAGSAARAGVLRVVGSGQADDLAVSVGGTLTLQASTIEQGGVVRAPLGTLLFQAELYDRGNITDAAGNPIIQPGTVVLLPGSVTSVSIAGQTIPYGGTPDGQTYYVDLPDAAGNGGLSLTQLVVPTVSINAVRLDAQAGATLDLRGGGTLAGSGFLAGRGGSADVLTTPLPAFNASTRSYTGGTLTTNPVYAILPGSTSDYAPSLPQDSRGLYAGQAPSVGAQITVGAGVPGLPAGTYTLLPAYYALLPGAWRVQLNPGAVDTEPTALARRDGGYVVPVTRSVANTGEHGAVPFSAVLTSGAVTRLYSGFNETSYDQYAVATAAKFGSLPGVLAADAKTLQVVFTSALQNELALSWRATTLVAPAAGGLGAITSVTGVGAFFLDSGGNVVTPDAILNVVPAGMAAGSPATADPTQVAVYLSDRDLDAIGTPLLALGGTVSVSGDLYQVAGSNIETVVRSGAVLSAGELVLTGRESASAVVVETGATLSTIGRGATSREGRSGYFYDSGGASPGFILLASDSIDVLPLTPSDGTTKLTTLTLLGAVAASEGTLAFNAPNGLSIDPAARFGARYVDISSTSISVGTSAALAGARLPPGLQLSDEVLSRLLAGDPLTGAPATQQLRLTATDQLATFGSVALTLPDVAGQPSILLLDTPAIYGAGAAADVATLQAGTIVWNGIEETLSQNNSATGYRSQLPGAPTRGGAGFGNGQLVIQANTIVLGYGPQTRPKQHGDIQLDRIAEGYGLVELVAAQITGNNHGSLAVYAQPAATFGNPGLGGRLLLATPLLTGASGSVEKFLVGAGGSVSVQPTAGGAPAGVAGVTSKGAEIDITAPSVSIATTVSLPSGRLLVQADGNIGLDPGALVDVAGRDVTFFDQVRSTSGGSATLDSAGGSVTQAAGAVVDVSSPGADGGTFVVSAKRGTADLLGTILGSAGIGAEPGSIEVRALALPNFNSLNAALTGAGVDGGRTFEVGSGNLSIGNELVAHSIDISADAGVIDVTGTVNASGASPGQIFLAARDGLTLEGTARLDVHETALHVDSYGQVITASNTGEVSLTVSPVNSTHTTAGLLAINTGAAIDAGSPDGVARGVLVLNAAVTAATNLDVSAAGPVALTGIASAEIYGWHSYDTLAPTISATGQNLGVVITQAVLNKYLGPKSDAAIFERGVAALLNPATGRPVGALAGLAGAGSVVVRPGVEFVSAGNLTVSGDLDLSAFRYATPSEPIVRGSPRGAGAPGAIRLRAAGQLTVNGSVTDGFAPPVDASNPDDFGWVVGGFSPTGNQTVVLPITFPTVQQGGSVALYGCSLNGCTAYGDGTYIDTSSLSDRSLNYNVILRDTGLRANFVIPVAFTLVDYLNFSGTSNPVTSAAQYTFGTDYVLRSDIFNNKGVLVYAAGTKVPAGTQLKVGWRVAAGAVLPFQVVARGLPGQPGLMWQAGTSFASVLGDASDQTLDSLSPYVVLQRSVVLTGGDILPGGPQAQTMPEFVVLSRGQPPAAISSINLRSAASSRVWAVAPMLAPGTKSFDIDLVSGADVTAADPLATQSPTALAQQGGAGRMVLADTHYSAADLFGSFNGTGFSVIRTGTGTLNVIAGGDLNEQTIWGIYTAGSQAAGVTAAFELPRGDTRNGTILFSASPGVGYEAVAEAYTAYYPDGGGNVTVRTGGSLTTTVADEAQNTLPSSEAVGDWLWRQGSIGVAGVSDQLPAWWINFGTYAVNYALSGATAQGGVLTGFTGIGTLGGGNASIQVATDVNGNDSIDQSLDIAVASTGRVTNTATGSLIETGGGNIDVRIGGRVNPGDPSVSGGGSVIGAVRAGTVTNLRGDTIIRAGAIGGLTLSYPSFGADNAGQQPGIDPRNSSPFEPISAAVSSAGLVVVPGDGHVDLRADGDLVYGGASDAGRVNEVNRQNISVAGNPFISHSNGVSSFSLWTAQTEVGVQSQGGSVLMDIASIRGVNLSRQPIEGDLVATAPGTLRVVASSGNLYQSGATELAPSANGQLEILVEGSIFGERVDSGGGNIGVGALLISGADPTSASTPFHPEYASPFSNRVSYIGTPGNLLPFGPDTPTTALHADDPQPARIYAATGDIVDFTTGGVVSFDPTQINVAPSTWYLAAKPVRMIAGRDIVASGLPRGSSVGGSGTIPLLSGLTSGNLFYNAGGNDVSLVSAGRDIIYSYFYVLGGGVLDVRAGRNLDLGYTGGLRSLGSPFAIAGDSGRSNGAAISLTVGAGAAGPDYEAIEAAYLTAANVADPAQTLSAAANAGKVVRDYLPDLVTWLAANYGVTLTPETARSYFDTKLTQDQRDIFLRQVYFAELVASGREETDPTSRRFGSYIRGRDAIARFFPQGQAYGGSYTATSAVPSEGAPVRDGGVSTLFGGAIQVLAPGGQVVLGTTGGVAPGVDTGFVTFGSGDIDVYAGESVLLGQSRIFTTFGGSIAIWSNQGDISAGVGAKSTVVTPPPSITYDRFGGLTLAPSAPSSGAGIATLALIPGVPAGDVDLIAPAGTIDAGEAGIRASGNANLAALAVVNAANIQVGGKTTGVPTVQTANIGALTSAQAVAGSSAATAQDEGRRQNRKRRTESVITVEVLGFGG